MNNISGGGTRAPTIGDNVYIGSGACNIGRVSVGDNCRIGANAVAYEGLPPNSVAVQQPTRVIRREIRGSRIPASY